MKKFIFLFFISHLSFAQFNFHVMAVNGVPQKGLFNNQDPVKYIDNNNVTQNTTKGEIFKVMAGPGWGYGLGLSYDKFKLATGVEFSQVNYARKLNGYRLKAFHITVYSDYQWKFNNFETYLGLETGIYTTKAKFNKDITLAEDLSQSRLGLTPRAGIGYKINKVKIRAIGKEVINANFPSFMFNILMTFDMGDF